MISSQNVGRPILAAAAFQTACRALGHGPVLFDITPNPAELGCCSDEANLIPPL
jgi:hypothetical protein